MTAKKIGNAVMIAPMMIEDSGARETSGQGVDRHLGGEDAEIDRAGRRRFRIGVLEPVVEQREGTLDAEGDEDQQHTDARRAEEAVGADELVEVERAGVDKVEDHPGQEDDPGPDLDDQIAHPGPGSAFRAPGPDQKDRGDGGEFPVDEESDEIAGEDAADGGTDIGQRRRELNTVADAQPVDPAEDGGDEEDIPKHQAQAIDPHRRELVAEDDEGLDKALVEGEQVHEPEHRKHHSRPRLETARQQRHQQAAEDQDRAGREELNHRHSSPRPASGSCATGWPPARGPHRKQSHRCCRNPASTRI